MLLLFKRFTCQFAKKTNVHICIFSQPLHSTGKLRVGPERVCNGCPGPRMPHTRKRLNLCQRNITTREYFCTLYSPFPPVPLMSSHSTHGAHAMAAHRAKSGPRTKQ